VAAAACMVFGPMERFRMRWAAAGPRLALVVAACSVVAIACGSRRAGTSAEALAGSTGHEGAGSAAGASGAGNSGRPTPEDAGLAQAGKDASILPQVGSGAHDDDAGGVAGRDATTDRDAAVSSEGALVSQAGARPYQCTVTREPALLGVSPWAGYKLIVGSNRLQLIRTEGGTEGAPATAQRCVSSSVDVRGMLGAPSALAEEAAAFYELLEPARVQGRSVVFYILRAQGSPNRYFAQPLAEEGSPSGAAIALSIGDANYVLPVVRDQGYLLVGGIYDEVHTDTAKIWSQKLDGAGKPVGDPISIFESSSSQRTANLSVQAVVPTAAGFLVLYSWFDATATSVDSSHYRFRFQALDAQGKPLGTAHELTAEVGTHILGNPALRVQGAQTLLLWQEGKRERDPNDASRWTAPLWSVVRVARLDDTGAIQGKARNVNEPGGPKLVSAYWADLGSDLIGLGWYEGEADFTACPQCWATGSNYFVLLADDLQFARSNVTSLRWQTENAGFIAGVGGRVGDDVLLVGDLAHSGWREGASATVRCTK
jgi:hypothetical protein